MKKRTLKKFTALFIAAAAAVSLSIDAAAYEEAEVYGESTAAESEAEPEYDLTTIVVEADAVETADMENVAYQLDSLCVLEFENEEEAVEALDKYIEEDPEASYALEAGLFDTGEEGYEYLSWGPETTGCRTAADAILEYYGSVGELPTVTVALIDTGIDHDHELLSGRIDKWYYTIEEGGTDAEDNNGHGTHVAGLIADATLPNVLLNAYEVTDAEGRTSDVKIAAAVDAAVSDGVDIINISLGGSGYSKILNTAIQKALDAGITVIAAAGNDAGNTRNTFPANYGPALTVSGLNQNLSFASGYSNYGYNVDLCAPGTALYSSNNNGSYSKKSGTSMACAETSAAAALVKTRYPEADPEMIEAALKASAVDLGDEGYDMYFGFGMVDPNVDMSGEQTEKPEFSLATGEYEGSAEVEISCADQNAQIYYSTDGSIPDTTDEQYLYTGALTISESTQLIAVAAAEGKLVSDPAEERYYIDKKPVDGEFTVTEKGVLTSYTGYQTEVSIPSEVGGNAVVSIGYQAFKACSRMTKVTIPSGVTNIQYNAFYKCIGITEVELPLSLESISQNAFSYSSKLKKVTYEGSVEDKELINISSGNDYLTNAEWTCLTCLHELVYHEAVQPWVGTYGNLEYWSCDLCGRYYSDAEGLEEIEEGSWILEPLKEFEDVTEDDFFYVPVYWAVLNGITTGTTETTFSPNNYCLRGQAVTFLWRAADEPEPTITENPFSDVSEDDFYYKAVLWAYEKGITTGTTETEFSPNTPCLREQVVTFLWRYAGKPEVSGNNPFVDVPYDVYYTQPVVWAYENGITTGTSDNEFSPAYFCLRGQVVTFLHRYSLSKEQ